MKKVFLSFLFFVFAFSFNASAQTIDATLQTYSTRYQPEKVYLHYDKAAYAAGETIWFKAYLMEGLFAAEGSKTFYVDWVADNGSVLMHSVSPVIEGVTNGQFELPSTYPGNFIHVRAYTKWMLNFDTAFVYTKDIRILSKNPVGAKILKPAIVPTIQFFPKEAMR
jgi:hypothetical protein